MPEMLYLANPLKLFIRELQPRRLLPNLTTGVSLGVFNVIFAVSLAALIFSGDLSPYLPLGIGAVLLGDVVLLLIVTVAGTHTSIISISQDGPAAILATVLSVMAASLASGLTAEQLFPTTLLLIVSTTLITGLLFLVLGAFKLGGLIRYLPYPVVGGFLAGTGWLLLSGGISLMTDTSINLAILQPELLLRWLPGLLFAFILLYVMTQYEHPTALPILFLVAIGLFYAIAWLLGTPVTELTAQGWLLGRFPEGNLWQFPLTQSNFAQVNWVVLGNQLPNIAPILLVSTVMLLLNISGLELITKRDMDLNRELIVAGAGNLGGGLVGGIVGFHTVSFSGLHHKLKGTNMSRLIITGVCGLALLLGPWFISFIPKLVLGGLLVYLGLSFLGEWIVQARRRFPLLEYGVIVLILLVIAFWGFVPGVAVGLLTAVVLFVINYSRINIVKHALTGSSYRSRVTRSARQRRFLRQQGETIQILQLHGYLFFGTAHNLLEQVRARLLEPERPSPHFLLLDFRQVTGVDSTAVLSFAKLKQLTQENDVTLVLTQLPPLVYNQFQTRGLLAETDSSVKIFPDLDYGFAWCEETLLAAAGQAEEAGGLAQQLAEILGDVEEVTRILAFLERQEVAAGAILVRQGDPPDNIFFIEQGQITAQLERNGRAPVRLETMHSGRVVGEIGFYLQTQRTATVVADEPSIIYRLSLAQLKAMETEHPDVAVTFHRLIIHLLAERVTHLVQAVDDLLR